ncbi:MAG TPA: HypC/HybG/HupF family hydrogenase formation chaperone [Clostridiaceae bacterium]|nr:HypC/HybG/HupF family hydrogenase formation chaperone [Clostridiaceae bacterium]
MCLAVPGKIIKIEDGFAEIDYGGISKRVSLRLVENAKIGDYALVHAGFVIQILNLDVACELEKFIKDTVDFTDEDEK